MSESTYYYADADKKPVGPYSLGRLLGLAAEGVITPTTKVIRKGDKQWVSYSESQPAEIPHPQQKVKGITDIAFLIDSSRSMAPCFEAVKDSVKMFIGELTGGPAHPPQVKEWRAKVVGYRDFRTDPEPLIDNPFTDDPAVLESQLDTLKAEGGEEEPESLLEGIWHVAQMGQTDKFEPLSPDKWRYRDDGARVVIIFTDASFHEVMEEPEGGTLDDIANVCQANRIRMHVFAPDEMDSYCSLAEIDHVCYYEYEYDETREDGAAKGLEEVLGIHSEGVHYWMTEVIRDVIRLEDWMDDICVDPEIL